MWIARLFGWAPPHRKHSRAHTLTSVSPTEKVEMANTMLSQRKWVSVWLFVQWMELNFILFFSSYPYVCACVWMCYCTISVYHFKHMCQRFTWFDDKILSSPDEDCIIFAFNGVLFVCLSMFHCFMCLAADAVCRLLLWNMLGSFPCGRRSFDGVAVLRQRRILQ